METFMSGAILIEGALLSFLLALWMTWLGLRGLFRLMPVTSSPATTRPFTSPIVSPSGSPRTGRKGIGGAMPRRARRAARRSKTEFRDEQDQRRGGSVGCGLYLEPART